MSAKHVFVFDDGWSRLRESFEQIGLAATEVLGAKVEFHGLDWDPKKTIQEQWNRGVQDALGTASGEIQYDAILLDIMYEVLSDKKHCFEPIPDSPIPEQTLVDELVGSGLPTVILTSSTHQDHMRLAGATGCPFLSKSLLDRGTDDGRMEFGRTLGGVLKRELAALRFNQETLVVENEFARNYDRDELGQLATRVVVMWENERILQACRETYERFQRPLRVLDAGCGTGRFEELLLCHQDTMGIIEQIVAYDFAPQYLVSARRRMEDLGIWDTVNSKSVFRRRIAEDPRLPAEYFDLVLLAFGVPCFTRYQQSVPIAVQQLRPQGSLVLTAYNRDSLNFEYEDMAQEEVGSRRSFFTADIDREKGKMTLPGCAPFPCHTFTPDFLADILRSDIHVRRTAGPDRDGGGASIETFPILHGCGSEEFITRIAGPNTTQETRQTLSYMPNVLREYPGFSSELYQMDRELCRLDSMRGKGHYINMIGTKRK